MVSKRATSIAMSDLQNLLFIPGDMKHVGIDVWLSVDSELYPAAFAIIGQSTVELRIAKVSHFALCSTSLWVYVWYVRHWNILPLMGLQKHGYCMIFTLMGNPAGWRYWASPITPFFDSVYWRSLETLVLSFFSTETFATALFRAFNVHGTLLILWAWSTLIDI